MTCVCKSKCVSFSFSSRPTDPTLLLIFSLQQEIKLEWPYNVFFFPHLYSRTLSFFYIKGLCVESVAEAGEGSQPVQFLVCT